MRIVIPLAVLVVTSAAVAVVPDFEDEYQLQVGGTILDVGYYAAPCVVDWDQDGTNDLILGQFHYGYIHFFKNVGTNAAPVFNLPSDTLKADGSYITMAYG